MIIDSTMNPPGPGTTMPDLINYLVLLVKWLSCETNFTKFTLIIDRTDSRYSMGSSSGRSTAE